MDDRATKFQRKSRIEGRAVGRAAVLVKGDEHLYFGVNRVGARIWELLQTAHSVPELVRVLTGEFAVGEEVCRRETEAFVGRLVAEGLVASCPPDRS